MDCDPFAWIVHRPVVDAPLDDIDVSQPCRPPRNGQGPLADVTSFDAIVAQLGELTSSTDAASAAG
jgi:hypothetical protein